MKLFAKYIYPDNGTETQRKKNVAAGLALNMAYPVVALRVGDWCSKVYLEGFGETEFNTVNFSFYDEYGLAVDVYSDPRTLPLRASGVYSEDELEEGRVIQNVSDFEAFALSSNGFRWSYLGHSNDAEIEGDAKDYENAKHLLLSLNETVNAYSVQDLRGNVSHMYLTLPAAQSLRLAGCVVEYMSEAPANA